MNTQNTLNKWKEYIEFQKMIDIVGRETMTIFNTLMEVADEYGFDRVETVDMFCEMFDAILDKIDPDDYDPDEHSLMN